MDSPLMLSEDVVAVLKVIVGAASAIAIIWMLLVASGLAVKGEL